MATQLQIRRGTTAQMNAFTGAEGELAVNTSTDTVHVHDGATAGGFALAKADGSNIGTYAGSFTTISASGAITGNVTGNLTGSVTGNVTGDVTGDLTGSVLTAAQTNITSVGTLSALAVTGQITATTGTFSGDILQTAAGGRVTFSTTTGNGGIQNDNGSAYSLNFGSSHATEASNVWINSTGGSVKIKNAGGDIGVFSSTGLAVTGTATMGNALIDNTGNATLNFLTYSGSQDATANIQVGRAELSGPGSAMYFQTNNGTALSTAMTITDDGSVGIGTSSTSAKLHVKDTTGGAVNLLNLETAWSSPSGNKSIEWADATNTLGRISVDYTSPKAKMRFGSLYNSGYQTGDVMTLTADGDLLVGGTSLNAASSVGFTAAGQIRQVFASGVANDSLFGAISGVSNGFQIAQDASNNQSYIFHNGGAASLKIDAAGSVGIGGNPIGGAKLGISKSTGGDIFILTDTSTADLIVNCTSGVTRLSPSTGTLALGTGNVEKLRIDASGNLLVGKTVGGSPGTIGFEVQQDGEVYSSIASGFNTYHVYANSGYRFYVNPNGGLYNYSANNVNLSDEREKKNIEALESQWDSLQQWSLKKFHYNADADSDTKKLGVIAQEVEVHNPEVISEFSVDEDTTRMAVKEQQMMWMAIKALQEAMERIETLEAKVQTLENK